MKDPTITADELNTLTEIRRLWPTDVESIQSDARADLLAENKKLREMIDEYDHSAKFLAEQVSEKEAENVRLREALGKYGEMVDKLINHCPIPECEECSRIVCPFNEPLHLHHDGCPACSDEKAWSKTWIAIVTPPPTPENK